MCFWGINLWKCYGVFLSRRRRLSNCDHQAITRDLLLRKNTLNWSPWRHCSQSIEQRGRMCQDHVVVLCSHISQYQCFFIILLAHEILQRLCSPKKRATDELELHNLVILWLEANEPSKTEINEPIYSTVKPTVINLNYELIAVNWSRLAVLIVNLAKIFTK